MVQLVKSGGQFFRYPRPVVVLLIATLLVGGSGCHTFHGKKQDSEPEIEGDSRMDRVGAGIRAALPYIILPAYLAMLVFLPSGDADWGTKSSAP